jgi:hypothetical protein
MLNHKQLVIRAKEWLRTAKQCNPVFTEKGSAKSNEMPDAIGWNSDGSILVECKTSLIDFKNDSKKSFRKNSKKGMGKRRYYMLTQELYKQLKETALIPKGWGVVIAQENGLTRQAHKEFSNKFKYNMKAELYYLRNRIMEIQNFGK